MKARLAKKLLQTLRRTQVVRPGDGLLVSIPRHMDMELAEVQVQGLRGEFEKITRDHASGWGIDNFCGLGANYGGFFTDVVGRAAQPGDRFLLATDGLTKHVKHEEVRDILRRVMTKDLAVYLVELANERGGCDNTTVIAVEICP